MEERRLDAGSTNFLGHVNRVFSVKFLPDSDHLLVSAGADSAVLLWDLRSKNVGRESQRQL